jgi:hypothetical protein
MRTLIISHTGCDLPIFMDKIGRDICFAPETIFFCMDSASQWALYCRGINYIVPQEYLSKEQDKIILKETRDLIRSWKDYFENDGMKKCFYYDNMDTWSIIEKRMPEIVCRDFSLINIIKNVIEEEKIRKVIMLVDSSEESALLKSTIRTHNVVLDEISLIEKQCKTLKSRTGCMIKLLIAKDLKHFFIALLSGVSNKLCSRLLDSMSFFRGQLFVLKKQYFCFDKGKRKLLFLMNAKGTYNKLLEDLRETKEYDITALTSRTINDLFRFFCYLVKKDSHSIYALPFLRFKVKVGAALNSIFLDQEKKQFNLYKQVYLGDKLYADSIKLLEQVGIYDRVSAWILKFIKPRIKVCSNDNIFSLIFGMKAKLNGVSQIRVPSIFDLDGANFRVPDFYDNYCVSCSRVKKKLVEQGIEDRRIDIVGFPESSDTINKILKNKEYLKEGSSFKDRHIWLYTGSAKGILDYYVSKVMIRIAISFPKETLVIRPHPLEGRMMYQILKLLSKSRNVSVISGTDLAETLSRTQLVITKKFSQTGFLSMINENVVISLDLDWWTLNRDITMGGTMSVRKLIDLEKEIIKISGDIDHREEIRAKGAHVIKDCEDGIRVADPYGRIINIIDEMEIKD